MGYNEDIKIITDSLVDKEQIKTEKDIGSVSTMNLVLGKRKVKPTERRVVILKRDTSKDTIYGRAGTLYGNAYYDGNYEEDFEFERVVNYNRTFKLKYLESLFVDKKYFEANLSQTLDLPGGFRCFCFFSPDGKKLYTGGGYTADVIFQYNLSVPYDLSSASYYGSKTLTGSGGVEMNIFISPDGYKLFLTCEMSKRVDYYSLSTAWDITTASYVTYFYSSDLPDRINGLWFSPDGTKMFIRGKASPYKIYSYSLSTAWDISTASYVTNKTIYNGSDNYYGYQLQFSSDGRYVYLDNFYSAPYYIYKYRLSTKWDITTLPNYPVKTYFIGSAERHYYQFYLTEDYIFIVDDRYDKIEKYELNNNLIFENEVIESNPIYLNEENITYAKFVVSDGGYLTHYLSADGGTNWETVTNGQTINFTYTGTNLKWKASASSYIPNNTTSISYLEVSY